MLAALLTVGGCAPHRTSFVSRIREDCAAGDHWACGLLDSLVHSKPQVGSPYARGDTELSYGFFGPGAGVCGAVGIATWRAASGAPAPVS